MISEAIGGYLGDYHKRHNGMLETFTILAGREQPSVRHFELLPINNNRPPPDNTTVLKLGGAKVSLGRLKEVVAEIERGHMDHLSVKNEPRWRNFYDVKDRNLQTEMLDGTRGWVSKPSVACGFCRVLLPLDCVHVDHQRPQTGGQIEAVAKVFRALGLTLGAPKGGKSLQGLVPPPVQATVYDRYTLTDEGAAIYTLIKLACTGPLHKEFQSRCLNHYFNLRPSCLHCNTSRGQALKFHQ